jgi:hypothetical protein
MNFQFKILKFLKCWANDFEMLKAKAEQVFNATVKASNFF